MTPLSWCEIDTAALTANVTGFRRLVGPERVLAVVVKSNAYGHGLVLAARAFLAGGADFLCVNDIQEAAELRKAGVSAPLYVLGPVLPADLAEAVALDLRLVVFDTATVEALARLAPPGRPARVHLKLETGTNRQGLRPAEALALARRATELGVVVEGVSSHYANVEDTTDPSFARGQLARFQEFLAALAAEGIHPPLNNFSNSAAAILWPDTYFGLVRVGISAYGMWPSQTTRVAAAFLGRHEAVRLRPALTWKTRIVQVKEVPAGESVGYGCTFRTTRPSRIAILPVGYRDGYSRRLSNLAHVLVRGQRAPVRGRVCMNLTMVDVTDIEGASTGDEVVLLGEGLPAETLAEWAGTINYEITTCIAERTPRLPR